jgi:hypothetical protein
VLVAILFQVLCLSTRVMVPPIVGCNVARCKYMEEESYTA